MRLRASKGINSSKLKPEFDWIYIVWNGVIIFKGFENYVNSNKNTNKLCWKMRLRANKGINSSKLKQKFDWNCIILKEVMNFWKFVEIMWIPTKLRMSFVRSWDFGQAKVLIQVN